MLLRELRDGRRAVRFRLALEVFVGHVGDSEGLLALVVGHARLFGCLLAGQPRAVALPRFHVGSRSGCRLYLPKQLPGPANGAGLDSVGYRA